MKRHLVFQNGTSGFSRKSVAKCAAALVLASGLAACGGGKSKQTTSQPSDSADVSTTTSSVAGDVAPSTTSPVPGASTPSTVAKGATATTTRSATAKTATTKGGQASTAKPASIVQVTAPPTTQPAAGGAAIQPGGTLTYMPQNELTGANFDPAKLGTVDASIPDGSAGYALYGGLVTQDPASLAVVPGELESVTTSDGKTWLLKLRKDLKFTDGTPFDAAAIKFNWDRQGDPNNTANGLAQIQGMQSYDAVDATTFRVVLKAVNGQWPRAIAEYALNYIASPTAVQGGNIGTKPVGAGPFVLKEWVRGDHTTFVRNPNYWDAPRPYLDQLIFRPITDATQRYNSFAAGQSDLTQVDYNTSGTASKAGFGVSNTLTGGGIGLLLNVRRAPWSDVRARKALQLALDMDQINASVNNGQGALVRTLPAPGTPFYDPTITIPSPDKVQAQKLFDAVAADNGGKVQVNILTNLTLRSFAEAAQGQLLQFNNVKVNMEVVTSTTARVVPGDFDVVPWGNFFLDPEPKFFDNYRTGSPRNFGGYSNPNTDAALDTAHSALDLPTRVAAYKTAQKNIIDDVPFVFAWRSPNILAFKQSVQGLSVFNNGIPFWDGVWLKR